MTAAQNYFEQFGKIPKRIVMLKGHSAGIGDILRSSAAWRALKNTFPEAELHLVLFTTEPGYVSESFIARHHLLDGFHVIDKKMGRFREWPRLAAWAEQLAEKVKPDLVIDFESAGVYSSFAASRIGAASGAVAVGINDFPSRAAFYNLTSVSRKVFARQRGLDFPVEYTYRDFVCLSALKIERNGIPVELKETDEGRIFRQSFREKSRVLPEAKMIGINIGCGTPNAVGKRPNLKLLGDVVEKLHKAHNAAVVLTGAKFERDVNEEFIAQWTGGPKPLFFDMAGQTSLLELAGLIRGCDLFISTDSGPYHMAVALGVPTLAVFRGIPRVHAHNEKHVRCIPLVKEEQVQPAIQAAEELLAAR